MIANIITQQLNCKLSTGKSSTMRLLMRILVVCLSTNGERVVLAEDKFCE